MSIPVVYRPAARVELNEAIAWYEQKKTGLGLGFHAAVERVQDSIAERPLRYPLVFRDVREAPLKRFPYCLYYRAEANQVVVLSVFHAARDPMIWQARV